MVGRGICLRSNDMTADTIVVYDRFNYELQDRARNVTAAVSGWFAADGMRSQPEKEKKNWAD